MPAIKSSKMIGSAITGEEFVFVDEHEISSGKDGIVWASFEQRQSEIIQSTLFVQDIHSEIKRYRYKERELIIVIVTNQKDVNPAIDFIWRSRSGLRLRSDWSYPSGQPNKSFEYWLGGNLSNNHSHK